MAYRCNLTTTARLLGRKRFAPSFTYSHHSNKKVNSFIQSQSLGFGGGVVRFRDPRCYQFLHVPTTTTRGFLLARNMSTTTPVVADKIMEVGSTQAPAVSEIADSWLPVAAMQYAIDGIHNFTGLNWFSSIVITTLVIKTLSVPFMIRSTQTRLKLMEARRIWEEEVKESDRICEELDDRTKKLYDARRKRELFKEHGVSTFTPLKWILIPVICFVSYFFAILNMAKNVPSFQTGGVSWFIDLSTVDSSYMLPFFTALSYWISLELVQPLHRTVNKNVIRGLAALLFLVATCFPKAILCHWITGNLFVLIYRHIMKKPSVKKLLNIPLTTPTFSSETKPVNQTSSLFSESLHSERVSFSSSPFLKNLRNKRR